MQKLDATLHEHVPVIEVAEAWLLDALMADPQLAHGVLLRISDRVAVVVPRQAEALLQRLRKLGHTPKVVEG